MGKRIAHVCANYTIPINCLCPPIRSYDLSFQFIAGSSLLSIACGASFLTIHFESRADNLYALPASQARADLAKQVALFASPPRISMVFVVGKDGKSNVLTKPVLTKLSKMDQFINHELRSADDNGWSFEDICYRQQMSFNATDGGSPVNADCMKMTPLDLYRTPQLFGTPIATRTWPYVPNFTQNRIVKADLTVTDPIVQHLPSGTSKLFSATGFLLLYHTSGEKEDLAKSLAWEQALIDFINDDIKPHSYNPKDSETFSSTPPSFTPHDVDSTLR